MKYVDASKNVFLESRAVVRRASGGLTGLQYAAVILSSEHVMTFKQRNIFKPIVVEIRELSNIPVEKLQCARYIN